MQKFKQIREAAKYNPYAIGMAAAKKKAGITAKHAENVPKSVIVKGHEIAKKIKANEAFDAELDQLELELTLESLDVEDIQAFMESEDFEQLDEISKGTLASYVAKASHSAANKMYSAGYTDHMSHAERNKGNDALAQAHSKHAGKSYSKSVTRLQGIERASKKLGKE